MTDQINNKNYFVAINCTQVIEPRYSSGMKGPIMWKRMTA